MFQFYHGFMIFKIQNVKTSLFFKIHISKNSSFFKIHCKFRLSEVAKIA